MSELDELLDEVVLALDLLQILPDLL